MISTVDPGIVTALMMLNVARAVVFPLWRAHLTTMRLEPDSRSRLWYLVGLNFRSSSQKVVGSSGSGGDLTEKL